MDRVKHAMAVKAFWQEHGAGRPLDSPAQVLLEREDKWQAAMTVRPMQLYLRGAHIKAAAIGAPIFGVDDPLSQLSADKPRQQLAERLLTRAHTASLARGTALLLTPAPDNGLLPHPWFGGVTWLESADMATGRDSRFELRPLQESDIPRWLRLLEHRQFEASLPLSASRCKRMMQAANMAPGGVALCLEDGGRLRGVCFGAAWPEQAQIWMAVGDEAFYAALEGHFFRQGVRRLQIDVEQGQAMYLRANHIRRLQTAATVVDVETALNRVPVACDGVLRLHIDGDRPDSGLWEVRVEQGTSRVRRIEREPGMSFARASLGGLASLLFGYPAALRGMVDACNLAARMYPPLECGCWLDTRLGD